MAWHGLQMQRQQVYRWNESGRGRRRGALLKSGQAAVYTNMGGQRQRIWLMYKHGPWEKHTHARPGHTLV